MGERVFISYAHVDHRALERLHVFLEPLRREGKIITWTDNEVTGGRRFKTEISKALEDSGIFIALVSPDYLHSSYCYDIEFRRAQALEEAGGLTILPVILEPCDWLSTPLGEFKALPRDGAPISTWPNENEAFLDVVKGIRRTLRTPAAATAAAQASPTRAADPAWSDKRRWRRVAAYVAPERIENPHLSTNRDHRPVVILNAPGRVDCFDVYKGEAETFYEFPDEPPPYADCLVCHGLTSVYARTSGNLGVMTIDEQTGDYESETLKAHSSTPILADFNHDATRFVSGDATGEVHVWNWPKRKIESTLSTLVEAAVRAAFSLDGRHVAIIGQTGQIELFDLATTRSLARASATVRGKRADAAFSLDNAHLAAFDGADRWDVFSVPGLARVPSEDWREIMIGLRGSAENTLVSSSAAGSLTIMERRAGTSGYERDEIGWPDRRATDLAVSEDGRHVAVILDRRELCVYAKA
ncbi:MAG TPA: toll/interleukin-1 receptor domain-containing protein [Allosphingosinicella sp.]